MSERMTDTNIVVVKCMVCGRRFSGMDAGGHVRDDGHNRWELLIPITRYYEEKAVAF